MAKQQPKKLIDITNFFGDTDVLDKIIQALEAVEENTFSYDHKFIEKIFMTEEGCEVFVHFKEGTKIFVEDKNVQVIGNRLVLSFDTGD